MCAAALLLLAGCGSAPVDVDAPTLSAEDARACRGLIDDLPDTISGHERRETTGDTAYSAAWGSPPIVLVCGVPEPKDRTDTSTCVQVGRTGWYVPDAVLASTVDGDESADVPTTELNYSPHVALFIPGGYRPEGFSDSIAAVGAAVERHLTKVGKCL